MKLKYIYIDSNPVDRLHFLQVLKHFPEINLKAEFSDAVNAKNIWTIMQLILPLSLLIFPFTMVLILDQLKDDIEIILLTKI